MPKKRKKKKKLIILTLLAGTLPTVTAFFVNDFFPLTKK